MAQVVTKRDWEEFMAFGRVSPNIRQEVLQSWRRSADRQIGKLKQAPLLTEEGLLTQRALARRLRNGARTALSRAGKLLGGTDNILLLCDRTGVVLDAVGDEATLARGQENHLHLGGHWTEDVIGTNAIGTAIQLGRPVEVHEAEHFCEEIQRWNCAATPIADPATGQLLGVVDISWPSGIAQANATALSAALAMQVETELTRLLDRERETLMERLHVRRLRRGNEPMLIVDRSGADVFATEDFARFCDDDRALSELRGRIPDLIDQTPDTIAEALSDCLPGTDMEVVAEQDDAIGVVIFLRSTRLRGVEPGAQLAKIGAVGSASSILSIQAQRLAQTNIPLLIEGETGTGKTYLAQAVHRASPQADGPFEMIDCSRLSAIRLREDVAQRKIGASNGVLCLNDPGAASPDVQKLLLNLVEDVSCEGMRVIALSTRSLYDEMKCGGFRGDLFYRIAGARLEIRPLRDRQDEIEPLLRQLMLRHATQTKGRELKFTSGAMAALRSYDWPGNLLEMANLIAALDALSPTGLIDERTLPPEFRKASGPDRGETLRDRERVEIIGAIEAEGGNLSKAAQRLGIARSTLYLKLDSYGIPRTRHS
ncbi:sigma-54-dependent Fis family transcriptional regulator [Roseibium aggregatum]|uniref:Sigma-54-dependent Fis family transcriptional regulator n=1 Tax=Roseibium aggregatum TaxID=187304 RepID=A0A939EBC3_9HYPH|nr:sigma 54-interacting transcriptional regulator [Roseibium aggregatum]MBN9670040.1 sigma-54-dependent Fis family transcriptional regulator [Roseibium aggregatum]